MEEPEARKERAVEISEVKVKLMGDRSDRLKAFCSITLDREFVVRDLKIIEGKNGMFVAMPSRKIMDRCPTCGAKNHLRARFCNECGGRLKEVRAGRDEDGRNKLHADIAHPINSNCRDRMQRRIIRSYEEERERAKAPDYKPAYEEEFDDVDFVGESEGANAADNRPPESAAESVESAALQEKDKAAQGGTAAFGAGLF